MAINIDKLNRSVAGFMLLSLALTGQTLAGDFTMTTGVTSKAADFQVTPKYANPSAIIREGKISEPYAVSLYAVPSRPIGEIKPIVQEPVAPIISLYAVPGHFPPVNPHNPSIFPVKEDPVIKNVDKVNEINRSLMNIEKDINKLQKPAVQDTAKFMKKSDIIKNNKDLDKINNIAKHRIPPVNQVNSRVQAGEFVYTNYGSYRTIEPASYSFFK